MINNMVEYLSEVWERLPDDEWNYNWKEIIGMTDEQMIYYDLKRD